MVALIATAGRQRLDPALPDDPRGRRSRCCEHQCRTIPKELHLPGPDFVDRVVRRSSDRSPRVLGGSADDVRHRDGCGGTGYVSILPVDQGIEHSAGASFAPNPAYFDPENIVKLAIEGGCNAVASTLGVLGSVARKYAHRIPFILKFNHNEFISYPNSYDQIRFASVKQAFDMGAQASARRSTSARRNRSGSSRKWRRCSSRRTSWGCSPCCGATCATPRSRPRTSDYHLAADLTGQANHLGVTIEADIIKQKLPETNGGYTALNFGKTHKAVYSQLSSDNPIDLTRYQLANCYMGRAGLINSGGRVGRRKRPQGSREDGRDQQARRRHGADLRAARPSSVRCRRASALLNAIQDVYLTKEVTIA